MPIIKPISDLRNNFNAISDLCHQEAEPIYITKNGLSDMVVMSVATYERQQHLLDLYQKLGEAKIQAESDIKRISHKTVMKMMSKKLNG